MKLRSLLPAALAALIIVSCTKEPMSATDPLPLPPGVESGKDLSIKPGLFSKGDLTQTEDIADLGGFLAALDAYKARLEAEGYKGETMKEQLRKFYECYANVWRVQYSDEKLAQFPEKDVHSHARLRSNGVVMNTDLWYELFDVDRNCRLYLPKERRAYIW